MQLIADLTYARSFSARNGFGPVPAPKINDSTNQHIRNWLELDTLLKNMTAAEEAAIRQISPLICMKSLRGGIIAAKGNTHCV